MKDWKKNFSYLAVIYRIQDLQEKIGVIPEFDSTEVDAKLAEDLLYDMKEQGYIEPDAESMHWKVTEKGMGILCRAIEALDRLRPFDIFSAVDLSRDLLDDEILDEENTFLVRDDIYDPRFARYDETDLSNYTDIRIALLTWLSANNKENVEKNIEFNAETFVALTNLRNGDFDREHFWFNLCLGTYFKDVEEIISGAYRAEYLSDDPEEIDYIMSNIYTAGMLERMKRDGKDCSNCHSPLASFMDNANHAGEKLMSCPVCDADFGPEPARYECPECHGDLHGGESSCPSCSASVNWHGQVGSISKRMVEETQYHDYDEDDEYDNRYPNHHYANYGYTPWYGYYNPWNTMDTIATALVLDAIF